MDRRTCHWDYPATSGRIHNVMRVRLVAASELPSRVTLADDLLVHGDNLEVLPRLPDGAFDVSTSTRRSTPAASSAAGRCAWWPTPTGSHRLRGAPLSHAGGRLAGLRRRLRGLRRLPGAAPGARPAAARRPRHALRPPRPAREPLRQGPPRRPLRPRVLPQRDRVGLRLRAKTRRRWPPKHDTILVYVKDPARYHFDDAEVERIPYLAPGLVGPEKAARGKRLTDTWFHTIVPTNGARRRATRRRSPRASCAGWWPPRHGPAAGAWTSSPARGRSARWRGARPALRARRLPTPTRSTWHAGAWPATITRCCERRF